MVDEYLGLNEDDEVEIKGHNWKWYFMMGVGIVLWYYSRGTHPTDLIVDSVDILAGFFIVLGLTAYVTNNEIRMHSPKIVSTFISDTYSGDTIDLSDDFEAIRLGGVDWGIKFEGRKATVIYHKSCRIMKGRNAIISATFRPIYELELPEAVLETVRSKNLPRPFFYGLLEEDMVKQITDFRHIIARHKEDNRRINSQKIQLNVLSKRLEDMSALMDKLGIEHGSLSSVLRKGMTKVGLKEET